jgi:CheY-like chemotaxis protein
MRPSISNEIFILRETSTPLSWPCPPAGRAGGADPPERMSTLGGLLEQRVASEGSSMEGERMAEQHASVAPPSRVIVADDHPLFRYALRSVLECSESFEVIAEAADGQQALELARTHNPDLVLMDIRMPKMDGLEATHAIKRELPQTVVLMLTAHEETSYLAEAIKAGAAGYVLKGGHQAPALGPHGRAKQEWTILLRRRLGKPISWWGAPPARRGGPTLVSDATRS